MRPSRRSSVSSISQARSNSMRMHGRVTKEDIRAASLRRWDGQARITTDWINLFHEPELCFPDGDLLIYLREPGQSSRGPAFRVHTKRLKEKNFDFLLDKCISQPPLHPGTRCLQSSCHGCDIHPPPFELYIPAPANSDLDSAFDHHITTRNFFAWLYQLPLAGRALGRSLVTLKERIDYYRPGADQRSTTEVISFAEVQRYLDFRECVDHALAALLLAECLQTEDLWIDAFSHCVGMSHRGLSTSLEYWAISHETKLLINKAQFELEAQLESARSSVYDFFENDLSGNFLGLSQAAREHFDQFRSWLHSYHIEQHGFWPPYGFENEAVEREVYASMYSDFQHLYYHLVDPDSSTGITDLHVSSSGGICTKQNIQAFDSVHRYESLSKSMPMLPLEPDVESKALGMQRRKSWNPLSKRRLDKDKRKALRIQAAITASNRDWTIMQCPLVRRYSEFESGTLMDDSESISMVDGRKIRWIVIYAILQHLISVMQTPQQVRNSEGVTYWLSIRPPKHLPWQTNVLPRRAPTLHKRRSMIEPDTQYHHSNVDLIDSNKPSRSVSKQVKEKRRQSLPAQVSSASNSRPSSSRTASLKRLIIRRDSWVDDAPPVPKSPAYCEILVHGYGNGLNQIDPAIPSTDHTDEPIAVEGQPKPKRPAPIVTTILEPRSKAEPDSASTERVPDLTPTSSTSVSRESSNASSTSSWSKGPLPTLSDSDLPAKSSVSTKHEKNSLPDLSSLVLSKNAVQAIEEPSPLERLNRVLDEDGFMRTIHFNTETWDEFLSLGD